MFKSKSKSKKSHKATVHPDKLSGLKRLTSSPHKSHKLSKSLLATIIVLMLVLAISVASYAFISKRYLSKNSSSIKNNIDDAINTLGGKSGELNISKTAKIDSSFGFTLNYDPSTLVAEGQVTDASSTDSYITGMSYEGSELLERRPYSLVKIFFPITKENTYSTSSNLTIISNIRKSFWDNKVAAGEQKIDALVRHSGRNYKAEDGWSASSPEALTINGFEYKKIVFTNAKKIGELEIIDRNTVYLTVQNDRPYVITIYKSIDSKTDEVKIYESVIKTLVYENFDAGKLAMAGKNKLLAVGSAETTLDQETSNTPFAINPESVFNVILKNQPAVVRISSLRCADIELPSSKAQPSITLKNVCSGGIGSGSIVSEDGYVATNGHVVTVSTTDLLSGYIVESKSKEEAKARINELLTYLVKSGYLSKFELDSLYDQLESGKIDIYQFISAFIKKIPVEVIKINKDEPRYYVQLGTEPMKINNQNDRLSIQESSTIVPAKYIGQDYVPQKGEEGSGQTDIYKSTSSDVAILKIEGKYPVVKIGSIREISEGSELTAMGYPGFVDGGLDTKDSKTKPTVTQGVAVAIEEISNKVLLQTTVPIAQGNSGGPAFNDKGLQIGLNTYGTLECPDNKCFGSGTARDIADLTALAASKKVKFDDTSKITNQWSDGLDAYLNSNYKSAVSSFKAVQKDYPAHYLAANMQALAESKVGSAEDKSASFDSASTLIYVGIFGFVVLVFAGGGLTFYLLKGSHKSNKQLVADTGNGPQAPPSPAVVPASPPQPPATPQVFAPGPAVSPTPTEISPVPVPVPVPVPPITAAPIAPQVYAPNPAAPTPAPAPTQPPIEPAATPQPPITPNDNNTV